jgi:dUTP pyrophosphatase
MPNLQYEKIIKQPDLAFATKGSAAFDLRGFFPDEYRELLEYNSNNLGMWIEAGTSIVLRTGIKFNIPEGNVLKIFLRSSLGFKYDLTLSNSVGIIDSDYKKEVFIKVTALTEDVFIEDGSRIAQGILEQTQHVELIINKVDSDVGRGLSGHSGKF